MKGSGQRKNHQYHHHDHQHIRDKVLILPFSLTPSGTEKKLLTASVSWSASLTNWIPSHHHDLCHHHHSPVSQRRPAPFPPSHPLTPHGEHTCKIPGPGGGRREGRDGDGLRVVGLQFTSQDRSAVTVSATAAATDSLVMTADPSPPPPPITSYS